MYILMNSERSSERSTTDIYASSPCFTRTVCTEGGKECVGENLEGGGCTEGMVRVG